MSKPIDRRDFNALTAAALGGLVAGATLGCGGDAKNAGKAAGSATAAAGDKHLCRGLNDCKGKGASGNNDCRGQGDCATVKHECAKQNDCKGMGGCGETAGINDCKGKGGCSVPLMEHAWADVRKRLESQWDVENLTHGNAPAAKEM